MKVVVAIRGGGARSGSLQLEDAGEREYQRQPGRGAAGRLCGFRSRRLGRAVYALGCVGV